MRQDRSFLFESIVREDDSQVKKIELATDPNKGLNFQFNIKDTQKFRDIFTILDYLVMKKESSIDFEKIAYKDYYVNQIIKEITQDSDHFDKQSDSLKDVLKESLHRRNQIYKQIKRSLDHFNNHKHLIDKQNLIRHNYWKTYLSPLIILTDSNLFFEYLSEDKSIYCYSRYSYNFDSQDIVEGYSWMEYSKKFSEEITAMYPLSEVSNISNTKPRSDIRVIRRSDTYSKRTYIIPDQYFETWIKSRLHLAILPYLQGNITLSKIEFSKSLLYSLVSRVVNGIPEDEEIKISFNQSKQRIKLSYDRASKQILVSYPFEEEHFMPMTITISSSIFYSLQSSLRYARKVIITKVNDFLPVIVDIAFDDHETILSYQPKLTKIGSAWQHLYFYHFLQFDSNFSSPFMEYIKGEKFFDISTFTSYEASLDFPMNWFLLSDREKEANLLVSVYQQQFNHDDSGLSYQNEGITCKIGPGFDIKCSCTTDHSKTICTYTLALLLFDMRNNMAYTSINANLQAKMEG